MVHIVNCHAGGEIGDVIVGGIAPPPIAPDEARDIAEMGIKITNAANEQLGFLHPGNGWDHISFCQIVAPATKVQGVLTGKGTVSLQPGKLDRSPSGAGTSAHVAFAGAQRALGW